MRMLGNLSKQEFANFLRQEINKETMLLLDFSFITSEIQNWWSKVDINQPVNLLKQRIINILIDNIDKEMLKKFSILGFSENNIAAVCIKNIFNIDSPKLAYLIHEAMCDIFQITDIHYPYEEHKTLYLKHNATNYKDWGSGYGEITPHSDDLYENLNIDYLALTTCRDITKTPTKCFFYKDILNSLTDDELFKLKDIKAFFKSGKNVNKLIERERHVVEYCDKYGFRFFFDFRIDNITGRRMNANNEDDKIILDKISDNLKYSAYEVSSPETGTFFVIANHKVLHARAIMNMEKDLANKFSIESDITNTPRLLYRSKGPRREYLNI